MDRDSTPQIPPAAGKECLSRVFHVTLRDYAVGELSIGGLGIGNREGLF